MAEVSGTSVMKVVLLTSDEAAGWCLVGTTLRHPSEAILSLCGGKENSSKQTWQQAVGKRDDFSLASDPMVLKLGVFWEHNHSNEKEHLKRDGQHSNQFEWPGFQITCHELWGVCQDAVVHWRACGESKDRAGRLRARCERGMASWGSHDTAD